MKSRLRNSVVFAMALAVSVSATAAEFIMRISHQFPPLHHTAVNLEKFAEEVQTNTSDQVEVHIFGSSQLFKPNQQHAAVAGGKIEAAAIINFQWGRTIPEIGVTVIPYLFEAPDKIRKFIVSDAADMLDKKMEEKGVKNIGWIVDANDGIFTSSKRQLANPEDFKGLKIRGVNKVFDAGLSAVGASPSAMPATELYQALQTGVLDAAITGVDAAYARKIYEVQKYGVASRVNLAFDNLVVNPKWWKGLPENIREVIKTAADNAVERSIPLEVSIPESQIKQLTDNGMDVQILTADQQKILKSAMQPAAIEQFLKESGSDSQKILELVQDIQ